MTPHIELLQAPFKREV